MLYSLILSLGLCSWICLPWPVLWLCLWRGLKKKPSLISPRFLSSHVKSRSLCRWHSIYYFKVWGNAIINHRIKHRGMTPILTLTHNCKHGHAKHQSWWNRLSVMTRKIRVNRDKLLLLILSECDNHGNLKHINKLMLTFTFKLTSIKPYHTTSEMMDSNLYWIKFV